jgi:NADP-dependent 3-hydroxy acid dehydrogenase YdfG
MTSQARPRHRCPPFGVARNAVKTQELAEQLKAKDHKVEVRTVDASDASSIGSLITDVDKQFGAIDVLHYDAASMRKATMPMTPSTPI